MISAVPAPIAVTRPFPLTTATFWSVLDQSTSYPLETTAPLLSRTVRAAGKDSPRKTTAESGSIETDWMRESSTVIGTTADTAS
jgi:hypothetical protein